MIFKILLVEDDPEIREIIIDYFVKFPNIVLAMIFLPVYPISYY